MGDPEGLQREGPQQATPRGPCCPGVSAFITRAVCLWYPGWTPRALTVAPLAQSQDCIAAALACSKILKELSKEEEDTDSSEEMLALADQYELRAIGESRAGPPARSAPESPWGPRPGSQPLGVTLCYPEVPAQISAPLLSRLCHPGGGRFVGALLL